MKKIGYILLQISGFLILFGGITDFAMTFYLNSLPESHLNYLKIKNESASLELKNLDYALLRAIGGCLISVGIGTLSIIYIAFRKKINSLVIVSLSIITVSEAVNASQMFLINSPYFVFPLLCLTVAWLGATFWFIGNKKESNFHI